MSTANGVRGYVGRTLTIKRDGNKVGAVVSKSVSINNEPIDVTSDDDSGFRTLMDASGTRSIDISVEGVLRTDALIMDAVGNSGLVKATDIEFPWGLVIRGSFRLNGLDITGEKSDKIQFSGTLQSSGAWTINPDQED